MRAMLSGDCARMTNLCRPVSIETDLSERLRGGAAVFMRFSIICVSLIIRVREVCAFIPLLEAHSSTKKRHVYGSRTPPGSSIVCKAIRVAPIVDFKTLSKRKGCNSRSMFRVKRNGTTCAHYSYYSLLLNQCEREPPPSLLLAVWSQRPERPQLASNCS